MLRVFTPDETVIAIGRIGFHFVGLSFLPMVTSLIFPVFFQAVGKSLKSSLLTVIRTVVLFVPLGFLFSRFGLDWFWLTFPVTEVLTSLVGIAFYRRFLESDYVRNTAPISTKTRRISSGSCIVVGRTADYVLKDHENVIRVFIHAPKQYRMKRVMEVYGDTPEEARQNIHRSDKARAAYYKHISAQRWADHNDSLESAIRDAHLNLTAG